MKNRKTFIGIALLIVVLLLGIGYAAITSSLTIGGTATATANDKNFEVVFTGETTTSEAGVTAEAEEGSTAATLNVEGLTTKGDSKSATFTIKNQSQELNAKVGVKAESITNTEFFKIESVVANSNALAPEGTTTVTVKVSLVKTPIEAVTGTINVNLQAEAVLGN